jgi:hypothetical protein
LDDPLQTVAFLFQYEIQNGSTAGLSLTLNPMGKNVSKHFFSETTWTIETKLPMGPLQSLGFLC